MSNPTVAIVFKKKAKKTLEGANTKGPSNIKKELKELRDALALEEFALAGEKEYRNNLTLLKNLKRYERY